MGPDLLDAIKLPRLPVARLIEAINTMLPLVRKKKKLERVLKRLERVLAQAVATQQLEQSAVEPNKSKAQYSPRAHALDAELDELVKSLSRGLKAKASRRSAAGPRATELLTKLFPRGVRPYTEASYYEEHQLVTRLLERCQGKGDLAAAIATLHEDELIGEIAQVNEAYGEAIAEVAPESPAAGTIRSARAATHRLLVRAIVTIHDLAEDDADPIVQELVLPLLAPLVAHYEDHARALKRRRRNAADRPGDALAPTPAA